MQREIGSYFWIEPEQILSERQEILPEMFLLSELRQCCGTDQAWFSSGRSALAFVLETIVHRKPELKKCALVPPYTCHTVLEPFEAAGYRIHAMPIDQNLCTDANALLATVEQCDAQVVLLHRYFGFDTLPDCVNAVEILRNRGIVVIEDRTQCLYSEIAPLPADYWVASIRKWCGVPDGGVAVCRDGIFEQKASDVDTELEQAKITAGLAKYRYLFENVGEKEAYLQLYQKAESILEQQDKFYTISDTSLQIQSKLPVDDLCQKRRQNYNILLNGLSGCTEEIRPLFRELPEGVVPLYFPVWVEDRKLLQEALISASIYAPVVWPKPERIPIICEAAESLYTHLLCIPIDQRYDKSDMNRIIDRIKMTQRQPDLLPDIYYLPEWGELYACRDGEEFGCYKFQHEDGTVVYPYVLRKTPETGDGEIYYDIITPYGFNGPCIIGAKTDDHRRLIEAFDKNFAQYCKDYHIIAEYVRFSPWLKNTEDFGDLYQLRDNGQTIAIDLTVEDLMRDEFSSKRRNQIRMAQRKGVTVEFDETGETVEEFHRLYQNTVSKNEIGSYYQFPVDFLKQHFQQLGHHICIANAKVEGKTISSSFILQCGEHLHYHFSANDYEMSVYQGNSLMLYETAKRGKAFGCKYLHLGGVGVAEPSLMHFKLSFTKNGVFPFVVGTRVQNQKVFDMLNEQYAGTMETNYFPPYRK
mgnify:CR=1 FL=1